MITIILKIFCQEVAARQHGQPRAQPGGRARRPPPWPRSEAGPEDGDGRERRPEQAAHEGGQEGVSGAEQGPGQEVRPRLLLGTLRGHVDHPRHRHLRRPARHRPQVHRVHVTRVV